jgi:hypothetical protein
MIPMLKQLQADGIVALLEPIEVQNWSGIQADKAEYISDVVGHIQELLDELELEIS